MSENKSLTIDSSTVQNLKQMKMNISLWWYTNGRFTHREKQSILK
ncbi:MAG: hypothetical protein ACLR43_10415 [Faecalibacillus faecis]